MSIKPSNDKHKSLSSSWPLNEVKISCRPYLMETHLFTCTSWLIYTDRLLYIATSAYSIVREFCIHL